MGGILRCIKNEYSLDQLENEINRTDSVSGFDELLNNVKRNNNAYIDIDDKNLNENNHYSDNFLEKAKEGQRSKTFSINPKTSVKI